VVATGEHMLLHVDTEARRASPMLEPVLSRAASAARAHGSLSPPDGSGRSVRELRPLEPTEGAAR